MYLGFFNKTIKKTLKCPELSCQAVKQRTRLKNSPFLVQNPQSLCSSLPLGPPHPIPPQLLPQVFGCKHFQGHEDQAPDLEQQGLHYHYTLPLYPELFTILQASPSNPSLQSPHFNIASLPANHCSVLVPGCFAIICAQCLLKVSAAVAQGHSHIARLVVQSQPLLLVR